MRGITDMLSGVLGDLGDAVHVQVFEVAADELAGEGVVVGTAPEGMVSFWPTDSTSPVRLLANFRASTSTLNLSAMSNRVSYCCTT